MKILRLILVVMMIGQLAACGSLSDKTKILPTQLTYSIVAQMDLNPNSNGDSTPVEFQLFELKDDSKLLAADYDSLVSSFQEALGSNYISHSDITILPGQFKFIEPFEVHAGTRYIGVMAHFGDPEVSQWKRVIKIKAIGKEYHILILFKEQEVLLDKVE